MKPTTFVRLVGIAFTCLIVPSLALAQRSITCESKHKDRQYCGNFDPDQVRFDRQIGGHRCVQGETWGVDRQGLWVERGCRAVFIIRGDHDDRHDRDRDRDRPEGGWWDPEPGATWPPRGDWHGGRWDRGGACFYKEPGFGGAFFCMRRGEERESLGDYGDKISSIRVFGNARTTVYDDSRFQGASGTTGRDVADLRNWKVVQKPPHTWNNRISAIRVH